MRLENSKLGPAELNMTPMIDIVFLLISFFTLVINFSQTEQHEQVSLPKSELAQPPDTMPSDPMTLQITSKHEIFMGMTRCYLDDQGAAGTGKPFSAVLRLELQVLAAVSRVDPKNVTVILRADENVQGEYIKRIIQACQNQGMENFILRARQSVYED